VKERETISRGRINSKGSRRYEQSSQDNYRKETCVAEISRAVFLFLTLLPTIISMRLGTIITELEFS
jgi:hypothetical protein